MTNNVAPAPGVLYLVATPIGNLGDLSARAVEALKNAACVACEDTRRTIHLLHHHGLQVPLISLNEHNEARRIPELLGRFEHG